MRGGTAVLAAVFGCGPTGEVGAGHDANESGGDLTQGKTLRKS